MLTLGACGGAGNTPAVGRDILVLGVMGTSDSENAAVVGMLRGVELAVDEYNASGDSRFRIEIKEFNTQADPGEAGAGESEIANTERLIGVVGPFAPGEVSALGPVFENAGMSYVVPAVTATEVPAENWRGFRRLVASDRQEGGALADHAVRRVGGAIALVTEQSGVGAAFAEGATEALGAAERPAGRTDTVAPESTPSSLAAALVEAAPEAVLYGGGGATGKALLDSLREAEFQGLVIASHQLRELNPDGLAAGVLSASVVADPADAGVEALAGRFRDEFQAPPSPGAVEAYEGAFMILDAIEEVGGNPRVVTDFLRLNNRFRGDSKIYVFDERGQSVSPPVWIYESTAGGWRLAGRSDRLAQDR